MNLEDTSTWSSFSRSSTCEREIPTGIEKRLSNFEQLLVVYATRPDRLQSAMTKFACEMLDLKELSPTNVNLKRLCQEETEANEPILIIISPGADPSQELQDLAKNVVGSDKYHQVAMGQGQAEIAMQLLHECSKNGDWLCLKNLHLVTPWLSVLEKELNSLKPHENFRLWLTAESHPKFPTILLQESLKVTYEAPPGIKKNLLRTYETWSPEYVSKSGNVARSQALFVLAWFHAVMQERRNYIPQGWTKFYEFNMSDLRASAEMIDRLCQRSSKEIEWNYVHGLVENAFYGGRVDNVFDNRVMVSYLKQFFDSNIVGRGSGKRIGPLNLPNSCQIQEFIEEIDKLPEIDKPSYFGLPENIERSTERTIGLNVINQLRILQRSSTSTTKFQKELWKKELTPILNLWKSINQGLNLIQTRVPPPTHASDSSPLLTFVQQERANGISLVHEVHGSLSSLSKVIRGILLLTDDIQKVASALLQNSTPTVWLDKWQGPSDDPLGYIRGLVSRTAALTQKWVPAAEQNNLLDSTLDLSELFHPDTFMNALRQTTARSLKTSMDALKLACSWSKSGGSSLSSGTSVKLGGIQLEGCAFEGGHLVKNQRDSPSVTTLTDVLVAWVKEAPPQGHSIALPLYFSNEREKVVMNLDVPCDSDIHIWLQSGAALFLKNV